MLLNLLQYKNPVGSNMLINMLLKGIVADLYGALLGMQQMPLFSIQIIYLGVFLTNTT